MLRVCLVVSAVLATSSRFDSAYDLSLLEAEDAGRARVACESKDQDTWLMKRFIPKHMPGAVCPYRCEGNCGYYYWNKLPPPDEDASEKCCCLRKGCSANSSSGVSHVVSVSNMVGSASVEPMCCKPCTYRSITSKYNPISAASTSMHLCEPRARQSESSECIFQPYKPQMQLYRHVSEWHNKVMYKTARVYKNDTVCYREYRAKCLRQKNKAGKGILRTTPGIVVLVGISSCGEPDTVEYFGALRNHIAGKVKTLSARKEDCSSLHDTRDWGSAGRGGLIPYYVIEVDEHGDEVWLAQGQNFAADIVGEKVKLCVDAGPLDPKSGYELSDIDDKMLTSISQSFSEMLVKTSTVSACLCCKQPTIDLMTRITFGTNDFLKKECKLAYALGASQSDLQTDNEVTKKAMGNAYFVSRSLANWVAPFVGPYLVDWSNSDICKATCNIRRLPAFEPFKHHIVFDIPGEAFRNWIVPSRNPFSFE
eukprot:TRINITY_DN2184_c0_g5_i1.p1 TRINITY_DN2184_c0_g5~~TRINITY_DN2184_c0_g5_i1.p1  ORF type:complete len:480 (-),score=26.76 TRINITY_DN2184_c0_g5_i1:40-1479(-)